ncbi:MAG: Hint domain-containing protein [Pseudomonadota bacterium]
MGGAVLSAAMIAWAQSQIEGIPADKYKTIAEGLTWRWNGEPIALAGRPGALLLTGAMAPQPQVASASAPAARTQTIITDAEHGSGFVVTDGERAYTGLPVSPESLQDPLLVFHDGLPPQATDLKILKAEPGLWNAAVTEREELLCFTPGTEIMAEAGPVRIEDLGPGDRVMTRDSGQQEVVWIGHRRLSGARLYAFPQERPIRIRHGAMQGAGPYEDLLVSPDHRILQRDQTARALWGENEVLVRAADLLGKPGVSVDPFATEAIYVTVMLENHEVIWANGMEVESFNPGLANFGAHTKKAKASLLEARPDLAAGVDRYGPSVRRSLSPSEAEILHRTSYY